MAILARAGVRPTDYNPDEEKPKEPPFDPRDYDPDELEKIEAALEIIVERRREKAAMASGALPAPYYEHEPADPEAEIAEPAPMSAPLSYRPTVPTPPAAPIVRHADDGIGGIVEIGSADPVVVCGWRFRSFKHLCIDYRMKQDNIKWASHLASGGKPCTYRPLIHAMATMWRRGWLDDRGRLSAEQDRRMPHECVPENTERRPITDAEEQAFLETRGGTVSIRSVPPAI